MNHVHADTHGISEENVGHVAVIETGALLTESVFHRHDAYMYMVFVVSLPSTTNYAGNDMIPAASDHLGPI